MCYEGVKQSPMPARSCTPARQGNSARSINPQYSNRTTQKKTITIYIIQHAQQVYIQISYYTLIYMYMKLGLYTSRNSFPEQIKALLESKKLKTALSTTAMSLAMSTKSMEETGEAQNNHKPINNRNRTARRKEINNHLKQSGYGGTSSSFLNTNPS